jgi:hypothetical protein
MENEASRKIVRRWFASSLPYCLEISSAGRGWEIKIERGEDLEEFLPFLLVSGQICGQSDRMAVKK